MTAGVLHQPVCRNCSRQILHTPKGRRGPRGSRYYCNSHCRSQFYQRTVRPLIDKTCPTCGKPCQLTDGQRYCSPSCRRKAFREKVCEDCNATYTGRADRRFCNPCRDKRRTVPQDRCYGPRCCYECQEPFVARVPRQRFCGKVCNDRHFTVRRRVLLEGAMVDEDITLGGVFHRCGGVCAVCRERIDLTVENPMRLVATIDHRVPLVKGGKHEWGNVQLAHYGCNSSKRDR